MAEQEVAVAEAPQDADAGDAAVAGGGYVDIAVADINDGITGTVLLISRFASIMRTVAIIQLAEGFEDGVGGGFPADALGFVLSDGDVDLREEMGDERLRGCHHLIADHCQPATAGLQLAKKFGNAVVWAGGVERVLEIILSEGGKAGVELRVLCTFGYSALHEPAHAIAHEPADIVERVFGHAMCPECVVDAAGEVVQGVEQRAVEVENEGFEH